MTNRLTHNMPKSIWELEAEVRRQLEEGVDFGGRVVGVSGLVGDDLIRWVKLEGDTHRRLLVVYVRGAARVTVGAVVRDDDSVEITSVSLDKMCGGGSTYA
jgi:hypothetical protein